MPGIVVGLFLLVVKLRLIYQVLDVAQTQKKYWYERLNEFVNAIVYYVDQIHVVVVDFVLDLYVDIHHIQMYQNQVLVILILVHF